MAMLTLWVELSCRGRELWAGFGNAQHLQVGLGCESPRHSRNCVVNTEIRDRVGVEMQFELSHLYFTGCVGRDREKSSIGTC